MSKMQLKYIIGVISAIYFGIITISIFKKPDGWSMMPYSWQQSWHPSYALYIFLIIIGVVAAIMGYRVFSKKINEAKTDLTNSREKVKYCSNCGVSLREGASFCSRCGTKVKIS